MAENETDNQVLIVQAADGKGLMLELADHAGNLVMNWSKITIVQVPNDIARISVEYPGVSMPVSIGFGPGSQLKCEHECIPGRLVNDGFICIEDPAQTTKG